MLVYFNVEKPLDKKKCDIIVSDSSCNVAVQYYTHMYTPNVYDRRIVADILTVAAILLISEPVKYVQVNLKNGEIVNAFDTITKMDQYVDL